MKAFADNPVNIEIINSNSGHFLSLERISISFAFVPIYFCKISLVIDVIVLFIHLLFLFKNEFFLMIVLYRLCVLFLYSNKICLKVKLEQSGGKEEMLVAIFSFFPFMSSKATLDCICPQYSRKLCLDWRKCI